MCSSDLAASAAGLAWADGLQTTEALSAPVSGNETAAGLPSRVPGTNLLSGSAAGAAPEAWRPVGTPAAVPREQGRGMAGAARVRPRSLPPRSPQQARTRLSGFQLGNRRAEGLTSSEGEGN